MIDEEKLFRKLHCHRLHLQQEVLVLKIQISDACFLLGVEHVPVFF